MCCCADDEVFPITDSVLGNVLWTPLSPQLILSKQKPLFLFQYSVERQSVLWRLTKLSAMTPCYPLEKSPMQRNQIRRVILETHLPGQTVNLPTACISWAQIAVHAPSTKKKRIDVRIDLCDCVIFSGTSFRINKHLMSMIGSLCCILVTKLIC